MCVWNALLSSGFGGATSACHLISHWEIADVDFAPTGVMQRMLMHCINTATSTFGVEVQEPPHWTFQYLMMRLFVRMGR